MPKRKRMMFFIIVATLPILLMSCSVKEGTFIQGDITEINKESGDMKINIQAWTTVGSTKSSTEAYEFEKKPEAQTIRVSNPEEYRRRRSRGESYQKL